MTHEEAIAMRDRFQAGEELTDSDIDSFVAHMMEEPCEACESLRQSVSENKGWRPRSIAEFHALIIADAVLREG